MWRRLWFLWVTVIVGVTTLPWSNYTGHAHWDNIVWIPFAGRKLVLLDILGNVVLFVPFGLLLARWLEGLPKRQIVVLAFVLAGLVSGSVEFFQIFCHERFPSTTDLGTNLAGALIGVWVAIFCSGDSSLSQDCEAKNQDSQGQI